MMQRHNLLLLLSSGNKNWENLRKRHGTCHCHTSAAVHHPYRTSADMGLRDFLRPKFDRRKRSKARSEIENPNEDGPPVPRPTASTPDLRIGASTSPLILHSSGSNDMQADSSQAIHLETNNPSGAGPSVSRPTESTPDLRIGTPTELSVPHPEPNGVWTVSSQSNHLTILLFA